MDKLVKLIDKWKKARRSSGICLLTGLLICLWTGCEEAIDTSGPNAKGLVLPYNADGIYGETAQTVQWVLFAGNTETDKSYITTGKQESISGQIPIRGGRMLNDIYTVVNPDTDLSAALADVKNHPGAEMDSLKKVKLLTKNLPADVSDLKVQRYHCYQNVCVQNDGTITYGKDGTENIGTVGISKTEFPMAKLHVEFAIPDVASMTFGGEKLVIQGIHVEGPNYSYLLPGTKYDGSGGYSERTYEGLTACDPNASAYSATADMLIPEYLRASDTAPKAQLIILANRYKDGTPLGSTRFSIPIGNAMVSNAVDTKDWDVNRNQIYTFKFTTISGSGTSIDEWKVTGRVIHWDEQNIPTQVEEANGLFLETTQIDNFRSFRMPRYVRFKSIGIGEVTVDAARDAVGNELVGNDFDIQVLWDGPDHKSGSLALKKGNWRTADYFTAYVKLSANNITKTLIVNTVPTRYASTGFLNNGAYFYWTVAMNYTPAMKDLPDTQFSTARLIQEYSEAGGTGCAAYYEGSPDDPLTGKGCWRVSTIREGLWYLRDKNITNEEIWSYELCGGFTGANEQAYTARTRPANYSFPAPVEYLANWDFHNLDGPVLDDQGNPILIGGTPLKYSDYYRGAFRYKFSYDYKVLCVLDDKLEAYYNIGVNAADNPVDVKYGVAQTICQNLREGEYSDWRLPTAAESTYALVHAGTEGIPNNFDSGLYWLDGGMAAGVTNPDGTSNPPGGIANVRCVRQMWNK